MATIVRGGLQRGDQANWDGITKTRTRIDATGGTVTGLTVNDYVDVLQVYGSGTERTRTTIDTAKARIATSNVSFLFATGTWTIDDDLTIPANITCQVPAGVVFDVASGKTLTFSGPIWVEQPSSWTSGSGTVSTLGGMQGAAELRTAAERTAGITPTNFSYPFGHVRRYGTTLNQTTLERAFTAAAGATVYLAGGATHTVTGPITVTADTNIEVMGDGIAIIDASGATLSGSALFLCAGTLGSSLGDGLASAVTKGDRTLSFTSSTGLVAGDLIILRNATDSSWNGDNGSYRQGEFLVVKSVSGTTVTLSSAVIDSYAATCTVHKVTPTRTRIQGPIELRGNTADTSNLPTILMQYGLNNVVDGVKFKNTTSTCVEFSTCFRPVVQHVETGKYLTDAGSIQATGIIFSGCQYAVCRDSTLIADRHGASTGGGGVCVDRFNVFERCFIASRTAAAADFHGSAEFCEYRDCHIDGAINLSGARNRVVRNVVYPHATVTSLINLEAAKSIDHTIEGNTFYLRGAAIYVIDANDTTDINANTTEGGILRFRRNYVIDESGADRSYLFIRNNGSTASLSVFIEGNEFEKTNTSFYGNVLAVSVVSGSNFARLTYLHNVHINTGFGTCADVDAMKLFGELGIGTTANASPTFGTTVIEPSDIDFEKTVDLGTPGTAFTILAVGDGTSFLPTMVSGRADTNITATTGDFMSVGVNANDRRADFGVFGNAASSSQHAQNSKLRFMNSSELSNQVVAANEVLALMSVSANADNATIANNIGGSSQTVTVRVAGRMIGNMPDA